MGERGGKSVELNRMADAAEQDIIRSNTAGKNRYMEAMIANARSIAARMADAGGHANALLAATGTSDPARLASGIRDGSITDDSAPGLGVALRVHVRAELALTNPGFLARREGE